MTTASAPSTVRERPVVRLQRRTRPLRPTVWAPAVAVLLVFAVLAWGRRWTGDDAFIVFRVVEQVLAGNGVVFNVGERVEAVTSPLWLAALTAARLAVPVPVEWLAVVLGLALTVAGLGLAMAAAARLSTGGTGPLVPAGVLVWLGLAPAWDFATAGLDGGLGLAWIGACAWVLARCATGRRGVERDGPVPTRLLAAALLGLGPVVRPDFAVLSAVWLVTLLALERRAGLRALAALTAAALALPVVVELGRMAYYATLVPTTVLAKEPGMADWAQGWRYLRNLADPYVLVVPLLAAVLLLVRAARCDDRRRRAVRCAVALAGALHATLVVRGGGDFMHARLLLPGLFALLVPVAVVRLRSRLEVVAVVALAAWAVVAGTMLRVPPETPQTHDGISDQRAFYLEESGEAHPVVLADFHRYARTQHGAMAARLVHHGRRALLVNERRWPLDPAAAPTVVYETGAIGLPGMAAGTDVHVLDRLGLADAVTARLRLDHRLRPGHDKPLPMAWVWGRYGDGMRVPEVQRAATRAARTAMACPPLRRLHDAITAPLTPRRALANVIAAPSLTTLRFPREPTAAAAELCRGEAG